MLYKILRELQCMYIPNRYLIMSIYVSACQSTCRSIVSSAFKLTVSIMACAEAHVFLFYNFNILLYFVVLMAFLQYILFYTSNSSITVQPASQPSIHPFIPTNIYLFGTHSYHEYDYRQTDCIHCMQHFTCTTKLVVIHLSAGPRTCIYDFAFFLGFSKYLMLVEVSGKKETKLVKHHSNKQEYKFWEIMRTSKCPIIQGQKSQHICTFFICYN